MRPAVWLSIAALVAALCALALERYHEPAASREPVLEPAK